MARYMLIVSIFSPQFWITNLSSLLYKEKISFRNIKDKISFILLAIKQLMSKYFKICLRRGCRRKKGERRTQKCCIGYSEEAKSRMAHCSRKF